MLSNVYPSWIHAILLILLKNSGFFKRSYMQGYLSLTLAEYQNGPGMSDLINAQCPRMENKTHIEVYDHSDLYHS